jgi:cell wall-associated NlpC family hydrolase
MKSSLYILLISAMLCLSFTCKKEHPKKVNLIEKTQAETKRDSIISYAKQYLGTPYLYAGNDPKKGFDCSGFTSYVFHHFDVNLPRSSSGYKNLGTALKPDQFKVGDVLVFYGYKDKTVVGHVGIICEANGMQSKFIHASSGKAGSVTISDLDSEHYSKRFYKCIDVLSE